MAYRTKQVMMNARERAEAHMRVMAALMERTEAYRAISAPVALVAGVLSASVAAGMLWYYPRFAGLTPRWFVLIWLCVLAAVLVTSAALLWRDSRRRGESFDSHRMRFTVLQLFPSMLAGAGITFWHTLVIYQVAPLAFYWMVFYGLALLATDEYAPKSLVVLGWGFLLAGLMTAPVFYLGLERFGGGPMDGAWAMGCTFGLFHIAYAIWVWPRRARG